MIFVFFETEGGGEDGEGREGGGEDGEGGEGGEVNKEEKQKEDTDCHHAQQGAGEH